MHDDIFELAAAPDAFDTPLRNIRVRLDGTTACFDLIPSAVIDRPIDRTEIATDDEAIAHVLMGGKPIVEASRLMRVWFESVSAIVIQEEFVQLHATLEPGYDHAPRLKDGKALYPFLILANSKWKQRLPDYQGGDDPNLKHFQIFSMECHIDVLGRLERTEWLPN